MVIVTVVKSDAKRWLADITRQIRRTTDNYLNRRPHRSFRRTLRRDYERSLAIPGYWAMTLEVVRTLRAHRRVFIGLTLLYALLGGIFVGIASQETFGLLSQLIDETSSGIFTGGWSGLGQAGLLLISGLSGGIYPELSDLQQVSAIAIALLIWLTTVWLLRSIMAGSKPRLRDGLYNAGAPIVATVLLSIVMILQLLPATFGVIMVNSAIETGVFSSGFMAMVISVLAGLLVLLSAYWVIATLVALVVVTLPGMYPWQALKSAGDIVVGRRLRLLLRVAWLLVTNAVILIATLLPVIVLQRALAAVAPAVSSWPLVPLVLAVSSSFVVVWSAAYVYVLYRKVVDDDSAPA